MSQITITDDLAQAIAQAGPYVTLIDSKGRTVGQVSPLDSNLEGPIGMTEEHIAELKRRMAEDDGTRYSFAEVIERVRGFGHGMTRFTVTATPKAESDLARLWLAASDRQAISDAANTIDRLLRDDAPQRGSAAVLGLRQLIIPPLVAEFTVEEKDRIVTIWSISHVGELTNGH